MWQRGIGGSDEMKVTKHTSISSNTDYSIDMQNGVYFTSRVGSSANNSFIKGYVQNGQLTEIYTYTGVTITYTNGTLTINPHAALSSSTNDLYFFKMN